MADAEQPLSLDTASLGAAVASLTRALTRAGVETPDLDARRLVEAATGLDPVRQMVDAHRALDAASRGVLLDFARRRLAREPVSRIVGRRSFYGRDFVVTPATLDPRPETETLVETALALLASEKWTRRGPVRILDVGTGTGAILLTLLTECPLAHGVGTDIDEAALAVAAVNAELLGVDARVTWRHARTFDGLEGPFDLVVANPPYIPTGEIEALAPEVRRHDPRIALDGGVDGLAVICEIVTGFRRIAPAGIALIEVGDGQSDRVARLGREQGEQVELFRDLADKTRFVALLPQL